MQPVAVNRAVTLFTALLAILSASHERGAIAAPLLPDLIAWESGPPINYMRDGSMDLTTIDNKVLYRFSQPIANIGKGPLELRDVTHPNLVQDIYQRIYQSEGGVNEEFVGSFPDANPPYSHLWLVGIAEYRIRTVTSGNGVGPVVASQIKTSYGLFDNDEYNLELPGAPGTEHYTVSSQYLGISVGWADVYGKNLPGQWIDVTGLADGQYWLETEVDPNNVLQEIDNTNNITRVLVNLVIPEPLIKQGDYNGDDIVNAADYVAWQKTLGQSVPRGTAADGDGNGVIGMPDLDVWQTKFGEAAPGGASAPVPEPSAGLMLLACAYMCATACCARGVVKHRVRTARHSIVI
jgi:hypothetical protein